MFNDRKLYLSISVFAVLALLLSVGTALAKQKGKIVHDAEYYIIEAQNGK